MSASKALICRGAFLNVAFVMCFLTFPAAMAQTPSANVVYTEEKITIDGNMQEEAWQKADVLLLNAEIRGEGFEPPLQRTEVRMLWDDYFLYIHAVVYEKHIVATLRQRDTIIYHDNDFEVFIDSEGAGKRYFEVEVNAHNAVMDLFMDRPYREGGKALMAFDIPLESAVAIKGTVNDGSDTDSYWTVEMKLPKSHLTIFGMRGPIKEGDTWRMNFSRVEWDYQWTGNRYEKLHRPEMGQHQEKNWVWAPTGKIDIHIPDKWGTVKFVKDE